MTAEKRKKVLIVDDDELMRVVLKRNVILSGYDVIVATNGQLAMQKIEEVTPDLIVVDLVMPDMNGFEMCRLIRSNERTKHIPIIIISGLQGQSDLDEAKLVGANVFMAKPVKSEEFINHMKRLLGSMFKAAT